MEKMKLPTENKEAEAIRDLAAEVLGWERSDIDKISFQMIRELVKGGKDTSYQALILVKAIDEGLDPRNPHPLWLGDSE